METLLITGGLGFIGSHFVRLVLAERPRLRIVNVDKVTYAGNPENLADVDNHSNYRFVQADIADRTAISAIFEAFTPHAVVNFAAESHVDRSILDPSPFVKTNIEGTLVLLEAAKAFKTGRILHISTDEVYGDIPTDLPAVDEEAPLRPSSPYSATKASADLLCQAHMRTYGTPVLIARSANNYGPNQFPEKLIPLMVRNAAMGQPLPVYGDGMQQRDWTHVRDNVRGILAVLERGLPGRVYNIGTEREYHNLDAIQQLCDGVAAETGRDPEDLRRLITFVGDRPGHDRRYAMSTARIRQELGWAPEIDFASGLRETIRWYLTNQTWVDHALSEDYRRYYASVYLHEWNAQPQ